MPSTSGRAVQAAAAAQETHSPRGPGRGRPRSAETERGQLDGHQRTGAKRLSVSRSEMGAGAADSFSDVRLERVLLEAQAQHLASVVVEQRREAFYRRSRLRPFVTRIVPADRVAGCRQVVHLVVHRDVQRARRPALSGLKRLHYVLE